MTLVAATNLTSPAGLVYASSDTDVIDRQTQVAGWMQALDAHDHTLTKGAAVGRLNTATTVADPTVSGNPNVRVNGDNFTWWANTTAAIFTAVNTTNAQTVGGAKTFSAAATFNAGATSAISDAVTNAVTNVLTVDHSSSGTPATNYGTGILFNGQSSTTVSRNMAAIQAYWTTATDASRASALALQTVTAAGALTTKVLIDGVGLTTMSFAGSGSVMVKALATASNSEGIYLGHTQSNTPYGLAANTLFLAADFDGAGSYRNLAFVVNNAGRWLMNTSGHFLAGTDNAYDIGASGATRPRTGYFGTSVVVGATPATTGALRLAAGSSMYYRNAANSADYEVFSIDGTDALTIGGTGSSRALNLATISSINLKYSTTTHLSVNNGLYLGASGTAIGFYGAAASGKQTVTGAKGGNAALTSLMGALSAIGLVTDSTT